MSLPPRACGAYVAFADLSGVSQDSYTLAVAHREDRRVMLDCLDEATPPFSPEQVTREYCAMLAR